MGTNSRGQIELLAANLIQNPRVELARKFFEAEFARVFFRDDQTKKMPTKKISSNKICSCGQNKQANDYDGNTISGAQLICAQE